MTTKFRFEEKYPNLDPATYGKLIAWYDTKHPEGFDGTDLIDLSGNHNKISLVGTPTVDGAVATTGKSLALTGTEYGQEEEIDDETGVTFWPTYPGLTTTATAAKIRLQGLDLTQYAVASGDSTHRLVLKDSVGAIIAWGDIRGADSAIAYGAELVTASDDRDFTVWGNVNWTGDEGGVIADGTGKMQITLDAGRSGADLAATEFGALTNGKMYELSVDVWQGTSTLTDFRIELLGAIVANEVIDFTIGATQATTTIRFVMWEAALNAISIMQTTGDNTKTIFVDNFTLKEVTSFGTDGVLIGNTIAGAAQTWTGTGAGDPNDPSTLEVYKVMGDLTGDLTVLTWVKPDDGQPAGNEQIYSKLDNVANGISFRTEITPTGKINTILSLNGANTQGEETNAAVFANGAQANFLFLGGVFDGTAQTFTHYVDGNSVASTTVGTIPATLWDGYEVFRIGAYKSGGIITGFFNGQISQVMIFNRALSAAEVQRIFNEDRKDYGI